MQEIRGCINHWANSNRMWRWLVEPVNQLLGQIDATLLWIRRADREKRCAFWRVIQFLREVALGGNQRGSFPRGLGRIQWNAY